MVARLNRMTADRDLQLIEGTCTFEELLQSKTWPSDFLTHTLECCNCGRRFQLSVETYHGSGGAWEMITNEGSSRLQ
jgi:hypothetical protein